MSNRPDGLSSYSIFPIKYYEAIIKHENHFAIYQKVKEWFEKRISKYKFIISIQLSKQDFFCTHSNDFKTYIKIQGQILEENISDNDIFEELYTFFEYLFIQLKMKELSFSICNNLIKIQEKKMIKNNK